MSEQRKLWFFFAPAEIEYHSFANLSIKELARLALLSKVTSERVLQLFGLTLSNLKDLYAYIVKKHVFMQDLPCWVIFHGIPPAEVGNFFKLIIAEDIQLNNVMVANFLGINVRQMVESQLNKPFSMAEIRRCEDVNPLLLFKLLQHSDQILRVSNDHEEKELYFNIIKFLLIIGLLSAPHDIVMQQFLSDYFLVYNIGKIYFKAMGSNKLLLHPHYLTRPIKKNMQLLLQTVPLCVLLEFRHHAILPLYQTLAMFMPVPSVNILRDSIVTHGQAWKTLAFSYFQPSNNWQAYWKKYKTGILYLMKAISFVSPRMTNNAHLLMSLAVDGSVVSNSLLVFLSKKNISPYIKNQLIIFMLANLGSIKEVYFKFIDVKGEKLGFLEVFLKIWKYSKYTIPFDCMVSLPRENCFYASGGMGNRRINACRNFAHDLYLKCRDEFFEFKIKYLLRNVDLAVLVEAANHFEKNTQKSYLAILLGMSKESLSLMLGKQKKIQLSQLQSMVDEYHNPAAGRRTLYFSA